jgi:hypothetical protein
MGVTLIVRLCSCLRFCLYYPVLIVAEYGTFIELSRGLGAKFYTSFTDGSWLVSKRFPSSLSDHLNADVIFHNYSSTLSLEEAWEFHKQKVEIERARKQVNKLIGPKEYAEWCDQDRHTSHESPLTAFSLLVLYFLLVVLMLLVIVTVLNNWPGSPNWIRITLVILAFALPHVVVQWYRNRSRD